MALSVLFRQGPANSRIQRARIVHMRRPGDIAQFFPRAVARVNESPAAQKRQRFLVYTTPAALPEFYRT